MRAAERALLRLAACQHGVLNVAQAVERGMSVDQVKRRAAFEADRRRINALTVRGFRVLRWTWAALHARPQELIDELSRVSAAPIARAA